MHLRSRGADVIVDAPAKLNLFFEILNRRSDGFHEVETFVYPIDLYDRIVLGKRTDAAIRFRLSLAGVDSGGGDVPEGGSNLVVRALELLRSRAGVPWGADVVLHKRIPSAAGLGGGSSDAAAALAAANVAWGLDWPLERLMRIGGELGSDVPLFFHRGAAICRGRGEIVEPMPACPMLHLVLVRPPVGLRTADVYNTSRIAEQPCRLEPFVEAFAGGNVARIGREMFNRLEPAAAVLTPWIAEVRRAFESLDCAGHQLTGSGTCYFGLCRHARHARRLARRLRGYRIGRTYAVKGSG